MWTRIVKTSRPIALPHWTSDEGTYFVTFRLIDSLPEALARIRRCKRIEEALDRGYGAAYLAVPEIGDVVFETLRFFDGKRYALHSGCVMPNHVHAVFRTAPGVALKDVMHG